MDVLIDLLPTVNKVQLENAQKDKKQRNKYNRQMVSHFNGKNSSPTEEDESEVATEIQLKQATWAGVDRRSYSDRRKLKNKRGRWLESRDRNDRRAAAFTLSVKI